MAAYLEAAMVILFGCSWPNNIIKSLKTKSTKQNDTNGLFRRI